MKKRLVPTVLAAAALMTAVAPAATGSDLSDVGYVDQAVIAALPAFAGISNQLAAYKSKLDRQFVSAMAGAHSAAARQQVQNGFQQRFAAEEQSLEGPGYMRAQLAIASVATTKGLSVVVDKRIIIYGGQDITGQVIRLLQSSQQILPIGTAPPPSEIGYVDQSALANSPQVKNASAQLAAFATKERRVYGAQLQRAGSDQAHQQQIAAAYNKTISDEQDTLLKPVVDHTQQVTAQVAQRRGLLLVIDHSDILYGGTDITTDVQNALAK